MTPEDILSATVVNYVPVAITNPKRGRPAPLVIPKEKPVSENVPSVESIDLSLVSVDRNYQRGEKPYAKKIAKEGVFDPVAVGHPVINRRPDKSLWAIDGQQRIVALKLRKYTHWPCRIVNLKTVEEEAELFGRLNGSEGTQSRVSQRDRFKALIAAKDPHALACVEAVKAGGMVLVWARHPTKSPGGSGSDSDVIWRQIESTSFVMGWAQIHGYGMVTRACRIVSESWPKSTDARRWTVVGGVFRLLGDHPELDDERAIRLFRTMPAITVDQEAKKEARTSSLKASGAVPFLLKVYNKGKRNRLGGAKAE